MAGNKGTRNEQEQDNIRQIRARITGKLWERLTLYRLRERKSVDAVVAESLAATLPKS